MVTGYQTSKLLGIPKADTSTGENQAQIVYKLLKEWGIAEFVVGLSFDTTAANTGIHKGACVLIEELLGRRLLHLACRHHVFELLAKAVFFEVFGASKSPEVLMFNEFKNQWDSIDKTKYEPLGNASFRKTFASDKKKEVVAFAIKV